MLHLGSSRVQSLKTGRHKATKRTRCSGRCRLEQLAAGVVTVSHTAWSLRTGHTCAACVQRNQMLSPSNGA